MSKPLIAIVGRPNVGKSTLFNRLIGKQRAIVQDLPGVTRDRHYGEGECLNREYMVVDTGGFEPSSQEGMLLSMREQAEIAITQADVVIALYDGPEGLTPADSEIVRILDRANKPVYHAVNKIDGVAHDALVAEFWETGVDRLFPVSAQHGGGVMDMMEVIMEESFPPVSEGQEERDPTVTRIAVIGKPNAGKSTLVNRLLGEDRLLVSNIPGTTRDAIDTWIERPVDTDAIQRAEEGLAAAEALVAQARAEKEAEIAADDEALTGVLVGESRDFVDVEDSRWKAPVDENLERWVKDARDALVLAQAPRRYLLIDTAGVRRRKWIKTKLERVSIVHSFKSIDRAEVCLLMIDATQGVTDQDAKLAGLIHTKGRGCVILVNKWDSVPDKDSQTSGTFIKELRADLPFLAEAPVVFISALTGQRVHRILGEVERVKENSQRRIPTSALNRFLATVLRHHQPPLHKNRRLKFYYATQVAIAPPIILLWVNDPQALHFSYARYLLNRIREQWDFDGVPVKLVPKARGKESRRRS